jgi:hypothetical protein
MGVRSPTRCRAGPCAANAQPRDQSSSGASAALFVQDVRLASERLPAYDWVSISDRSVFTIKAMTTFLAKLIRSCMLLGAVAVVLVSTGEARASCPSMADVAACRQVCACCEPADVTTPTLAAGEAGRSHASVGLGVSADEVAETHAIAPRGCMCRPAAPAAPAPKNERTTGRPTDPRRELAAGPMLLSDVTKRELAAPPPIVIQPFESPVYLRTSRLLI